MSSLVIIEELGRLRPVGNPPLGQHSDNDGDQALDDEDPAPRAIAADAREVGDGVGQQARKGAGENRGAEEEGHAPLQLEALVVHAD